MMGARAVAHAATWLALILASSPVCSGGADAQSPRAIDATALLRATGFGQISFVARDGNHLTARIYRSTRFDPAHGPVWFVMHGAGRDVDRYIRAAAPVAERYNALAIAIHFTKQAYPTGADYTLGMRDPGGWRAPEDMLYAEVERVFDLVVRSLGGQQTGYYLFGHSAGAQFTHRLLTFLPNARVLGAVAANAGWYTLPETDDPRVQTMPYGLIGGPVAPQALVHFFETPFVVLLGGDDTTTAADDDLVRGTPEAEAQGANRLERGRHYFAVAKTQAAALGAHFAWRLELAPGAGHDAAQVIASAGFLTFVRGAEPCATTAARDATGLTITEILADPPDGLAGDANGDGLRDPADDEFIEIVNRGPESVCLTGWTLGDAKFPERHLFPLGPALAPGQSAVVFGGGVPTGPFGGAQVECAAHGLGLQNAGDVLTLRAADGAIVRQVSWGNCGGARCADDHWSGTLGTGRSLTRTREPGARWELHPQVGGVLYSPGVDGGATHPRE
ncbi:MAG TPA: lamin tail domain-containing protein [Gemmatimonadales bacterium]|nr:lamin tail domain-containing protein [Gemmatimonadales bacterium]